MKSSLAVPILRRQVWLALLLATMAWPCAAQSALESQGGKPLSQMTLQELGNVEVTTVTKEPEEVWNTAAAVYVITEEDIRRSGATTLAELLRMVPGVEVARVSSDQWSVGIRGFGSPLSRSMLVLIDGRSVYSPLFAGVYWDAQDVLLGDIERIEVIRGPGGTIWGANAVNGVINVITKSSRATHGFLATTGGGNVDQGITSVRYGGGLANGLNFRVYGKVSTRGPEFHAKGPNFDDWRMGQAGFRMDWQAGIRDSFTLQGDMYNGDAGEQASYTTYTAPYTTIADGNAELFGANLLGRWKRQYPGGSDVSVTAYYDRTRHFEPQFGEVRDTGDVDFVDHLVLPKGQDFIWGLGGRVSSGNFVEETPTINFTPHHLTDHLYNAFLQDDIPLGTERLHLTIGSKFLNNNYTGFEIQPTARVLWRVGRHQSLWAAVTRAVRTPSRLDEDVQLIGFIQPNPLVFFALVGNNHFVSETLVGYELGYRSLITPKLYVDTATFFNNYDHLFSYGFEDGVVSVVTSPPPHLLITFPIKNGLKATTEGVEISPDWHPAGWWRLRGSYSYLHMDVDRRAGSKDTSNPALEEGSSPQHELGIQSYIDMPGGLEFDQTYRYVSSLGALKVPGYATADLRFGWRLNSRVELSIAGQNLLQPHHAEYAGPAGAPLGIERSVYANLTFRWKGEDGTHSF